MPFAAEPINYPQIVISHSLPTVSEGAPFGALNGSGGTAAAYQQIGYSVGETFTSLVVPPLRQVVSGTSGGPTLQRLQQQRFTGLNDTETPNAVQLASWQVVAKDFMSEIAEVDSRIQRQLEALSSKVEVLARALEIGGRQSDSAAIDLSISTVSGAAVEYANRAGTGAELLNLIADRSLVASSDVAPTAVRLLSSDDDEVRAAAGRALSVVDPQLARSELPAAIDREVSRFVASIFRGALRAAEL